MSDVPVLSLGGNEASERPVVDVYGKQFTLRRITRSVEKALSQADRNMRSNDEDADGDAVVGILADVMDALLAPANGHRTTAKKLVMDQWNADKLSLDQVKKFADALQEQAVADRPT